MSVAHVEILVEEPSMEAALRVLLPRILGNLSFEVYPYQNDLLQRLSERLRGYAKWLPQDWRIVVVVDRDDADCRELAGRMEKMASDAGLTTKTKAHDGEFQVVNRLAIEELEAWFFGDWDAVRSVYPRVPKQIPAKEKYRDPDAIAGGTWEAFERILQRAGYFKGGLRKIEAAQAVAGKMDPDKNRSTSFRAFRDALLTLAA